MKRILLIIAFLFFSTHALGAGGACPSGANYLNTSTNSFVTLASLGVTSCYYISAAGSDANNGLTESTPWLHAPGMSNYTGGVTPTAGTGFIFRGGDTYHFGNSSAAPYVGSSNPGWLITWSGTSGHPIYWGVDVTWFTGGSWARPIMTGDNPTSSTGVSACTYSQAQYTGLSYSSQQYNTFDSFEFTGFCWSGNQSNSNEHICCMNIIFGGQGNATPSFNTLEQLYIHGWTHETFSCSLSGGEPTGNCNGATAINLGSNSNFEQGDQIANNVVDGSDTDKSSICILCFGGYDIHNNVFRYAANGVVTNNTHVFHDNLEEFLLAASDGVSHTNAMKFNAEWGGVNATYNNVYRNNWLTSSCEVSQWMMPSSTDYVFNNIQYGLGCSANYFDLASTYGTGWTSNVFNNTWQVLNAGGITANPASTTANWVNMLGIAPGATTPAAFYSGAGTTNYVTDVVQTPTTASTQYPSTGPYPYSPVSGAAGIGAGTNEQTYCTALLGSGDPQLVAAGNACKSDTTFAVSYNATNHTVSWPARSPIARPVSTNWDVGPYQFSGASSPPVITSPTSTTCPVNLACSYQITATNSPTSYSETGLPLCLGLNTSTGLITGTCSSLTNYTGITLGATNAGGTGNSTLSVSVGYFVQQAPYCTAASVTHIICPFSNNLTAGDTIMLPFDFVLGSTVSSIHDTQGNTFTQIGSQISTPGGDANQTWYAKNIVGGADTITITMTSSAAFLDSWPGEYTGLSTTAPLDVQVANFGSASPANSGNATTTRVNDLIYGFCIPDSGACTVPGSGFTVRDTSGSAMVEDEIGSTIGAYNATATITGSGWSMQMAAMKTGAPATTGAPVGLGIFPTL